MQTEVPGDDVVLRRIQKLFPGPVLAKYVYIALVEQGIDGQAADRLIAGWVHADIASRGVDEFGRPTLTFVGPQSPGPTSARQP